MKDKNKKELQVIAEKILTYEEKIAQLKDVKENEQKIEDLMANLSLYDMLWIDEYIQQKT